MRRDSLYKSWRHLQSGSCVFSSSLQLSPFVFPLAPRVQHGCGGFLAAVCGRLAWLSWAALVCGTFQGTLLFRRRESVSVQEGLPFTSWQYCGETGFSSCTYIGISGLLLIEMSNRNGDADLYPHPHFDSDRMMSRFGLMPPSAPRPARCGRARRPRRWPCPCRSTCSRPDDRRRPRRPPAPPAPRTACRGPRSWRR